MSPSPRILIVEDEALIAMELEDRLTQLGHTVCGRTISGEEAVSTIEELQPELVLMDVNLAGKMNGVEAASEIRKNHDIPIVFLSAFSDEELLQKAAHTEPYGYLVKPFEERELHSTITMALYKNQLDRERAELTQRLQQALNEIQELRSLLPMCAWCKRQVCDEHGKWSDFETYASRRLQADITHGICPSCLAKQQKELQARKKTRQTH